MKAIDMFYKKILFTDLLAIALAGIISLLFAQTSYVFLNTSLKKQEYRNVQTDYFVNENGTGHFLTQTNYNQCSPAEEINLIQINVSGVSACHFLRIIFHTNIQRQLYHYKSRYYLNKHTQTVILSGTFPSIPIAFRKLII
jgi:hypothetical protein